MMTPVDVNRRRLLAAAVSAGALGPLGAHAVERLLTPAQSRGPFYPIELPLDSDNDLTRVQGRDGMAKGEIVELFGQVVDRNGRPVGGVQVEIWQCDVHGRYHHPGDRRDVPLDPNFQGYGRFVTGADGGYRFRTIKPVPYPGRTPHIHFHLSGPEMAPLTTQMYLKDAPQNARDFLFNRLRDERARASVLVDFVTDARAAQAAPVGRFDLVVERG